MIAGGSGGLGRGDFIPELSGAADAGSAGPDKEHAETSMLALHRLQAALVHVNTLLLQQVLAGPVWAKKLTDEDRRGLTALFWSNTNPAQTGRRCGTGLVTGVREAC
ncbi:Tn3 family transposase [Streptomyces sp. NPDC001514]